MSLKPRFLFAPPDGAHLVVDWESYFDYRDGSGRYLGGGPKLGPLFDLTVTNGAYYIYGNEAFWSGAPSPAQKPTTGYSPEGSMLAFRFDENRRVIAVQGSPVAPHGGGGWGVSIYADRFAKPDRSYAELVFDRGYPGRGVAAIGPDWKIVLAMNDRVLRVFSDVGDKEEGPIELVHTQLPYVAKTLSLAPPRILTTSDAAVGTAVYALDAHGVERWSAVVPFEVRQPPVDGAAGRVVAIGGGIASIQDGHVVWSQTSAVPMRGTAFADGSLALSVGAQLRIVDRDGAILQVLQTPGGEAITTPPCILSDGTVWVGTPRALYVAR